LDEQRIAIRQGIVRDQSIESVHPIVDVERNIEKDST
jgi:hypothetical protein